MLEIPGLLERLGGLDTFLRAVVEQRVNPAGLVLFRVREKPDRVADIAGRVPVPDQRLEDVVGLITPIPERDGEVLLVELECRLSDPGVVIFSVHCQRASSEFEHAGIDMRVPIGGHFRHSTSGAGEVLVERVVRDDIGGG